MADNLIRLQNIVGKQLELILIKLSQKLISERIRSRPRCCWVSDGYRRWIWNEIEDQAASQIATVQDV
jgi:hypothetical protein